ncbi:MAG: hypothetical protein WAO93_02475 [Orrella sp.]|jgi:hypothetical protein|uniref:hypothetical protein n=1 Tax=Orrella sp. TaxID=1921583 RepID=UPI003BD87CDA
MRMTNPIETMNHLFLGGLLLMFVIQHSAIIAPSPLKYGRAIVAQAQQYQPRTPPPMLDPEQVDAMFEEAEMQSYEVVLK